MANLVAHDELHEYQARLAHQVTDAFLQRGGDLLERQVQLQLLLALFGLLAESADRVLAVDLILSLHSDSPFSEKQKLLRAYRPGAESRYFLRTIGHPLAPAAGHLRNRVFEIMH